METLFMFGFADLAANKIFWVVMVWRFLNYYVYVVCGLGMNIFDIIRSFYRKHKAKKKALLAAAEGGGNAPPAAVQASAGAAEGEFSAQEPAAEGAAEEPAAEDTAEEPAAAGAEPSEKDSAPPTES